MTNKDAIYYLQYLRHDVHADSPYDIALVTAINTLSSSSEQIKNKKLSNADRIRRMTDEELAMFLREFDRCIVCQIVCTKEYRCDKGIIAWLKQEAKDDEAV